MRLLWPRLTSAHPSQHLSTLLAKAGEQISRGKTHDFRSIYPPHLRPSGPGDIGFQGCLPPRPPNGRLLCGSCSSGQSFAYSFLPTPPRDDAVAVQLGVPVTKAPRGLAPPSHAPCPAHQKKTPTGWSASSVRSGRPGSNRRRPAWEADILPLNYARQWLETPGPRASGNVIRGRMANKTAPAGSTSPCGRVG
jgi:hypothetical protein